MHILMSNVLHKGSPAPAIVAFQLSQCIQMKSIVHKCCLRALTISTVMH